jgi:hypothetical protein
VERMNESVNISVENKSTRHLFARKLMYEYLVTEYNKPCYRIFFTWPYVKAVGERKADLAVVTFPELDTIIWVEVQDTPLSIEEWKNKLDIKCNFQKLFVVLTSKTKKQARIVLKVLNKKGIPFEIFFVDEKREKLFILKEGKFQMVTQREIKEKQITLKDLY